MSLGGIKVQLKVLNFRGESLPRVMSLVPWVLSGWGLYPRLPSPEFPPRPSLCCTFVATFPTWFLNQEEKLGPDPVMGAPLLGGHGNNDLCPSRLWFSTTRLSALGREGCFWGPTLSSHTCPATQSCLGKRPPLCLSTWGPKTIRLAAGIMSVLLCPAGAVPPACLGRPRHGVGRVGGDCVK